MDFSKLGKIALFGAAGAVGHALAPLLAKRGEPYRVVGRDVSKLQGFQGAEAVVADFLSGEGVDAAATGISTIIYLAGAPYTNFEQHPIMTRNALAAAKRAGVSRFVHVAPVYSLALPATKKGRYRLEQEQLVLQADSEALHSVILVLPDFYGPHADNGFANYFMREAVAGKPATFIGPLSVPREFVFLPDVALPLLELASLDNVFGRSWNLGGAGTISGAELAKLVFAQLGKPQRVRAVSKFMLQIFGLFNPMMREFVEMYPLYDPGFVLDDAPLRTRLGAVAKTPYPDGVRATLAWMQA